MRTSLIAVALVFSAAANANPTGGTVASGSATTSTSGSTLNVNTGTSSTIINWQSFSIAVGETTKFNQPSAASVVLNRVTGPDGSSIMGALQSNGHVFLTNPNGIVFGSTAQVNVAGLVASTLDISDADFLSGNLHFTTAASPGSIVNNGNLVATDTYVALLAPTIQTTGSISAGAGGIGLFAGSAVNFSVSGGVISGALTTTSASNNIQVEGTLSTSGPVFIVAGTVGAFNGNGCVLGTNGCGGSVVPPPPIVTFGPGITPAGNTPGGSLSTGSVVATGSLNVTTGGGTVALQGMQGGAATNSPAVTGVALNLEKRELAF